MVDAVDGPAKLHAGHVQDRLTGAHAGALRAYRNRYESNLALYAEHGHLDGGTWSRSDRLEAADKYRELWEWRGRGGRDSTDLDIVRGGSGGSITQAQQDAIKKLIKIDRWLSENDRKLVRWVCGDGHAPAWAVRQIDSAYRDKTACRFREALDSLIVAISLARP